MRLSLLPSKHYAAHWPTNEINDYAEIGDLGCRYANMPAEIPDPQDAEKLISNHVKQELLLELCQKFHPYLMKYLVMICRGHVPMWGKWVNKDVAKFIQYFMPKGSALNQVTAQKAIRHLHLAFKGMETEEIYDILMAQLLAAIGKYDPKYTEKVKAVVEVIDEQLSECPEIRLADVNRHVEFDSNRHIRLLCRRGYLTPVKGADRK
jgi:hypothetical protein